MAQRDVFYVLRPDRRKAGQRTGTGRNAGDCGAALQEPPSRYAGRRMTGWISLVRFGHDFSFPCPTELRSLFKKAALGGPADPLAARHQRQDAGSELLHADNEIIEGQHHAAHAGNARHLVEHLCDGGIGADKHALVRREIDDPERLAPIRLGVRVLAWVVFGLRVAPRSASASVPTL